MPSQSVQFQAEIEDGTEIYIDAEVTTWRDEGTYRDGPLMSSVEISSATLRDNTEISSEVVEEYRTAWEERAMEIFNG